MRKIKKLLVLPVLLFAAFGCTSEETPRMKTSQAEEVEATLTLRVPSESVAGATKALAAEDEYLISEIDVLVFRHDEGDDEDYFFYQAPATAMTTTNQPSRNFRVNVKKSADKQQLAVFTNARAVITGLTLTTAMTRGEVLDRIEMAQATAWDVSQPGYTPLPMWGESDFRLLTDGPSASTTIDLVRALAKIDIAVADAAQAVFTLMDLYLYNPSTKGRLAPADINWDATEKAVTAPSEPAGAGGWSTNATPLHYAVADGKSLSGSIYTFEAPAAAGNADPDGICLLAKGTYGGEEGYYRIDFYDATADEYLPLLRNYLYNVQITGVSGRGYPTADEALEASFTNMTTALFTWEQGLMGHIIWDGATMLAVSDTAFTIYPEPQDLTLKVATNYTGGWKAEVTSGDEWLSISGASTGAGNGNPADLTLRAAQNLAADRTATVQIQAGRMAQDITVTQKIDNLLAIETGDVELIFSAANPAAQQLRIEWEPAAVPARATLEAADGTALSFAAGTFPKDITDADTDYTNGGAANLEVKPLAATNLATFGERRSILRVTASDAPPGTNSAYKDVLLRQFDYALTVDGSPTGMDYAWQLGTTYSFTVRSNTRWKVEMPDNEAIEALPAVVVGEPNNTTGGEVILLKTKNTPGATATLTFSSETAGQFADVAVTIALVKNEPNSYIVTPGQTVRIPVSKALNVWKTDADLGGLDLETLPGAWDATLLWQDAQGLISNAPAPQLVDGDTFIEVKTTPGLEGNAVVAFTIGGEVYWSWHLWVTNFDPNVGTGRNTAVGSTEIMARDLGATSSTPGELGTYGLLYQWGRKDPFPGAGQMTLSSGSYTSKPIYDIGGAPLTELPGDAGTGVKHVQVAEVMNLINAIRNPLTFYFNNLSEAGQSGYENWYTNGPTGRTNLWGSDYKSEFDPCPDGWKVPYVQIFNYVVLPSTFENAKGVELYDMNNSSIGFFPTSGSRHYTSGLFSTVGTQYNGWRASYRSTHNVTQNAISITAFTPAYGISVRCVKIE